MVRGINIGSRELLKFVRPLFKIPVYPVAYHLYSPQQPKINILISHFVSQTLLFGIIIMKVMSEGWTVDHSATRNKNCKRYFYVDNRKVFFSGDFDTGNLQRVQQMGPYQYRLWSGYDHPTTLCSGKTFFHFKVIGFKDCRVRFQICRTNLLNQLYKNGQTEHYRPVYRLEGSNTYHRIKEQIKITEKQDQDVDLMFEFVFEQECPVYFAFAFPYSYHRLCTFLEEIQTQISNPEIYFHKEVMALSNEQRNIHLITVTDKSNCTNDRQEYIQGLFQANHNHKRPLKVVKKPRVLVTARVHPGETSSSFCFEGLLKFLTHPTDYRAYLLRKNFHFLLVPMLNPDGVYHGMYRMDLNYCNLNRMYYHCEQTKQPSIWAVKSLVQSLGNVHFFFDLHGHASKKGFFVYGNAFDDIHLQTETEVFAKLLELNCPYFEKSESNFSKKHMKAKQKADDYSKEGCARVFMYKTFNIVHSYTLECGFHTPNTLNVQPPPKDTTQKFEGDYCYSQMFETEQNRFYTPQSYMNLGKAILVSILDVFEKNPYSRIDNSEYKTLDLMRKQLSNGIYQSCERFRMLDPNCMKKLRKTNDLIKDYYNDRFNYSPEQKEQPEEQTKRPIMTGRSLHSQRKRQSSMSIQSQLIRIDKLNEILLSSGKISDNKIQKLETTPNIIERSQNINNTPKMPRKGQSSSLQIKQRESSVWNFQVSAKFDVSNPMNRRRASLKNVMTQKKIFKLKGVPQDKEARFKMHKEKFQSQNSNYNSLKSLKSNIIAPKDKFYEQFVNKKISNFRNFLTTNDRNQRNPTEFPRIQDNKTRQQRQRGVSPFKHT